MKHARLEQGLRAVIFDVDGTLVESERDGHRVAFNLAFDVSGLPYEWSPEVYGALLATAGGRQRIASFLEAQGHSSNEAEILAGELHRLKTKFFEELVLDGAVELRPGVRVLIDDLKNAGVRLFVATTGTRSWVDPLLAQHFGNSTFELVLTGSEVTTLKPAPDIYQELRRQSRLTGPGIVAIEDSLNGLRAAHGAALPCVIVPNDYTTGDVSSAQLVVSGFGPRAHRVSGLPIVLSNGRLSRDVLERVAAATGTTEG
jgi:HAD superfamily hydrolase (TIGR01509 family)